MKTKKNNSKAPLKRKSFKKETYLSHLMPNPGAFNNRIVIGIPLTGIVRSEWMLARFGQIIPTNWSSIDVIQWITTYSPFRYMVADARNLVVRKAIETNAEWVFFIDHDVIIPPYCFLAIN